MISLGTAVFIAFVLGSVLKVLIPYYNKWKEDGRPFNLQYLEPIGGAIITAFPAIIADFIGWSPALGAGSEVIVLLGFLAGYGVSSGYTSFLEFKGAIDKALNKAKEFDQ